MHLIRRPGEPGGAAAHQAGLGPHRHLQPRPPVGPVLTDTAPHHANLLAPEYRDSADGRAAEAIVRKCVHCGFCTATCPTYQLLGMSLTARVAAST